MINDTQEYDVAIIHELLLDAFTPEELDRLFLYTSNPELRALANELRSDAGAEEMVARIITLCQKRELLSDLLVEVAHANRRKYARYYPDLGKLAPLPPRAPTIMPDLSTAPPILGAWLRRHWRWLAAAAAILGFAAILVAVAPSLLGWLGLIDDRVPATFPIPEVGRSVPTTQILPSPVPEVGRSVPTTQISPSPVPEVGRSVPTTQISPSPVPEVAPPTLATQMSPGIYIASIVPYPSSNAREPLIYGYSPTKATVWLTASGPHTYIVDSIRIKHIKLERSGWPSSGAVLEDAQYTFMFSRGSDDTWPLRPALRLSPLDAREVSFTYELIPDPPGLVGWVIAIIYYHTPDGKQGSLVLSEPPTEGVFLSSLLGANVRASQDSFGQVIAPNGLQRGDEAGLDEEENVIEYIPLVLDVPYPIDSTLPAYPSVWWLREREPLNEAIIQQSKTADIVEGLSSGDQFFFDLCAALPNEECEEGLVAASIEDEFFMHSVEALMVRHVLKLGDTLGDFAVSNRDRLSSESPPWLRRELIYVLLSRPTGKWFEALIMLAEFDNEACQALYLRHDDLQQDQYEYVQRLCDK